MAAGSGATQSKYVARREKLTPELVLALGRGPEGSGVKVNLGFFQPSEAIKVLLRP